MSRVGPSDVCAARSDRLSPGGRSAITGEGLAVALLGESFPPILALAIPLILARVVLVSRRPR